MPGPCRNENFVCQVVEKPGTVAAGAVSILAVIGILIVSTGSMIRTTRSSISGTSGGGSGGSGGGREGSSGAGSRGLSGMVRSLAWYLCSSVTGTEIWRALEARGLSRSPQCWFWLLVLSKPLRPPNRLLLAKKHLSALGWRSPVRGCFSTSTVC